jgi:hypothetical protein
MKQLMILILLAINVSANSGHIPLTVFLDKHTASFTYCEYNKPCPFINMTKTNNVYITKTERIQSSLNYIALVFVFGFILVSGMIYYTSKKIFNQTR